MTIDEGIESMGVRVQGTVPGTSLFGQCSAASAG